MGAERGACQFSVIFLPVIPLTYLLRRRQSISIYDLLIIQT